MEEREKLEEAGQKDVFKTVPGQECQGCLRAAFYWRRMPVWGEVIQPEMAWTEDEAKKPKWGEEISCQFCGRVVKEAQLTPAYVKQFDILFH